MTFALGILFIRSVSLVLCSHRAQVKKKKKGEVKQRRHMCLKFTICFNSKKRKWTHTSVAVTDDARAIEKS